MCFGWAARTFSLSIFNGIPDRIKVPAVPEVLPFFRKEFADSSRVDGYCLNKILEKRITRPIFEGNSNGDMIKPKTLS